MSSKNQNHDDQNAPLERLIRFPELQTLIPMSKPAIYNAMNEGRFPKPVKLGSRAVAWRESTIREYMDQLEEGSE